MITDTYTDLKSYTGRNEWMEIICLQGRHKLCTFPFMTAKVCDNISYIIVVEMYWYQSQQYLIHQMV